MFLMTSVVCLFSVFLCRLIFLRHVSCQIVCGLQLVTFCHEPTSLTSGSLFSQPDRCDCQHNDMLCLLGLFLIIKYFLECLLFGSRVFILYHLVLAKNKLLKNPVNFRHFFSSNVCCLSPVLKCISID